MFAKLRSSFGVNQSSETKDSSKSSGGYRTGTQQPLAETAHLATYLLPGSAAVQVSGSPGARSVASLKSGDKILGIKLATGNELIWATLQHIEPMTDTSNMLQNNIVVGLGGDSFREVKSARLTAEQVILVRDRKKKILMQPVRRLEIGFDSVVVFNADGLRWKGKNAQEVMKISSLKLVRDKNPSEGLYKLSLGSTDHSLLMSCAQDSTLILVVNSSNSTLNLQALSECNSATQSSEVPKMKIKNTFIDVQPEAPKEASTDMLRGIPRSYSDTDIHRLALELEIEEARAVPTSIFASADDMLDLSSNHSSALTSKSRASYASYISSVSGGSTTGPSVRVGTKSTLDENGNQSSSTSNAMQLSDYSQLPISETGVRLPAASVTHQPGRRSKCRKCAFFNTFSLKKGRVCKNGALCDFCHDSHDRFIHRR